MALQPHLLALLQPHLPHLLALMRRGLPPLIKNRNFVRKNDMLHFPQFLLMLS